MGFEHILAVVACAADSAFEGSIVEKILMSILIIRLLTEKHIFCFLFSAKSRCKHPQEVLNNRASKTSKLLKSKYLLVSKVASFVVTHVSLCPEALTAALWTRIGPLILVNPDMDLEVLLLTEGLVAVWIWTLEGLCPVMNVHMGLKANLTRKDLIAAWLRTSKGLGCCHNTGRIPRTIFFVFFLFSLTAALLVLDFS